MTVVIYLPVSLALAVALATRWIAERGTPGTTARGLSAAALLAAAARNTVAYLVEGQADDDAATVVGDRGLTAQAAARTALAASPPPAALSIGGGPAVRRVRALGEPGLAPRRRRLLGAAVLAAGILAASTVATAQFVALARVRL
jgi:hypothetical protein